MKLSIKKFLIIFVTITLTTIFILSFGLSNRAIRMYLMAQDSLSDIEFYGKVIDQHGTPVIEADILIHVAGGGEFAPGSGDGWRKTDAEGQFKVMVEGHGFTIAEVEHPTIAPPLYRERSMRGELLPGNKVISSAYIPYSKQSGSAGNGFWSEHSKPESPYIIKVWRVNSSASVITQRPRNYGFLANGGYTSLIDRGKYSGWKEAEGKNEQALIALRCEKGSDIHNPDGSYNERHGSWTVTIEAIDGGIQAANEDDVYLYRAPTGGYQPSITVGRQAGTNNYSHVITDKAYYFTAQNGKYVGSLRIDFEPWTGKDWCLVRLAANYSFDGSYELSVHGEMTRNSYGYQK